VLFAPYALKDIPELAGYNGRDDFFSFYVAALKGLETGRRFEVSDKVMERISLRHYGLEENAALVERLSTESKKSHVHQNLLQMIVHCLMQGAAQAIAMHPGLPPAHEAYLEKLIRWQGEMAAMAAAPHGGDFFDRALEETRALAKGERLYPTSPHNRDHDVEVIRSNQCLRWIYRIYPQREPDPSDLFLLSLHESPGFTNTVYSHPFLKRLRVMDFGMENLEDCITGHLKYTLSFGGENERAHLNNYIQAGLLAVQRRFPYAAEEMARVTGPLRANKTVLLPQTVAMLDACPV
jgi:hypothetical protein